MFALGGMGVSTESVVFWGGKRRDASVSRCRGLGTEWLGDVMGAVTAVSGYCDEVVVGIVYPRFIERHGLRRTKGAILYDVALEPRWSRHVAHRSRCECSSHLL